MKTAQINKMNITVVMNKITPINDKIKKEFNLTSCEVKNNKASFVGIITHNNNVLLSFPLNYFNKNADLDDLFQKMSKKEKLFHIKVMINSILNYQRTQNFVNNNKEIRSSFPFEAYLEIVKFYQDYGLPYSSSSIIQKGIKNVSWRNTFKRSHSYLINYGNKDIRLMYYPFYEKTIINYADIITRAVIFALNYTYKRFYKLLNLTTDNDLQKYGIEEELKDNKEWVIFQLNQKLHLTFEDKKQQLIINLIKFFKQLSCNYNYQFSLVNFNYEHVWESAVGNFLSHHFTIENSNFNEKFFKWELAFKKNPKIHYSFKKDTLSKYDLQNPKYQLQPDHYNSDNNNNIQFIFDSKYMTSMNELNYKQVLYNILYFNKLSNGKILNALILPSYLRNNYIMWKYHSEIDNKYLPFNKNILIYEVYLSIQIVLKDYTNLTL